MEKHRITERPQTHNFGHSLSPTSAPLKYSAWVLVIEAVLGVFTCDSFAVSSSSRVRAGHQRTKIVSNSTDQMFRASAGPELTAEQEVAALKKEELELAERLMRDFPDNVNPVVLMGNIWEQHGDATKAVEFFKKVLEGDPNRPGIYTSIGRKVSILVRNE